MENYEGKFFLFIGVPFSMISYLFLELVVVFIGAYFVDFMEWNFNEKNKFDVE